MVYLENNQGKKDLRNFNFQLPRRSKTQAAEKEIHKSKFSHLHSTEPLFQSVLAAPWTWCGVNDFHLSLCLCLSRVRWAVLTVLICKHALLVVPEISAGCQGAGKALEGFVPQEIAEERTIKVRDK